MVLFTNRGNTLPPEAVELSKEDALIYQKKFISNWPLKEEVFFLQYGSYITGASAFASSAVIFRYLQRTFHLKNSARTLFVTVPGVLIPTFFSVAVTNKMLTEKVLLQQMSCPLCQQVTFSLAHFYTTLLHPAIYNYITLSSIAYQYQSYNIPDIKNQPKQYLKLSLQILKSGQVFKILGLIQSAVVLILPFLQNKELDKVMSKAQDNYYFEEPKNFVGFENKL